MFLITGPVFTGFIRRKFTTTLKGRYECHEGISLGEERCNSPHSYLCHRLEVLARYSLNTRLGVSQIRSGRFGEEKKYVPLPGLFFYLYQLITAGLFEH